MKIRRRRFLATVALLLPMGAFSQDVGVLNLNPLHLELPATWTFDASKRPIEGHGPRGEKLLVTVMRQRPGAASGSGASVKDGAQAFAHGPMVQLASKGGMTVVRPVGDFPAQEGKVGFSAGSERSGLFRGSSFFVQYLLASPDALIYLTFEGEGAALPAMQQFDEIFKTQRWDD